MVVCATLHRLRGRIRPLVALARIVVDFGACLASQRFVSAVLVPGSASLQPCRSRSEPQAHDRAGRPAGGARQPLSLRDQQPVDDRRNDPEESGPLRQSFVPAERQGPHGRPQGLPARHQEHQTGRRDHLQLWPRLFPQRHHAARLQMRQVPGETRRGPGQNTSQGSGEVAREGRSQAEDRIAPDLSAGSRRVGNARREVVTRSPAIARDSTGRLWQARRLLPTAPTKFHPLRNPK